MNYELQFTNACCAQLLSGIDASRQCDFFTEKGLEAAEKMEARLQAFILANPDDELKVFAADEDEFNFLGTILSDILEAFKSVSKEEFEERFGDYDEEYAFLTTMSFAFIQAHKAHEDAVQNLN